MGDSTKYLLASANFSRRLLTRIRRLTDEWMRLLSKFQQTTMLPWHTPSRKKIKIAILSTGINLDAFGNVLEKQIYDVRDFCDVSGNGEDTIGMGTHQFDVISRVAPEAHISVLKVFDKIVLRRRDL